MKEIIHFFNYSLTIDVTEDIDFEDDSSDEDYEPSLNFTLRYAKL